MYFARDGESGLEVIWVVYWSERIGVEPGVILTEKNFPDGWVEAPMVGGECQKQLVAWLVWWVRQRRENLVMWLAWSGEKLVMCLAWSWGKLVIRLAWHSRGYGEKWVVWLA